MRQEQFDYYSKDESGQQRFVPDSADKQQEITPEIEVLVRPELLELYAKLESAGSNLRSRMT